MKKIKVVHILPMLSPGGAERVAVHIARGLDQQRFEVGVISIRRRVGCDLDCLLDAAPARVWYLGKGRGFDSRTYLRLHRVLTEYRPDVVHTHLHVLRYALPSLLLLRQLSSLHTVHNLAEREVEPGARCIQRCAFSHGMVPVAVSDEVAKSLMRVYGIQHCRVIPNGIPTDDFARPRTSRTEWRAREGFLEDHVLFACVARFETQKNHALLLKAFAQGPASDPNAHLVLVGEGILRERLKEQAKELGIAHKTHFLGLRTDVPDVLGAMDVFVLSSDWEGNPLSVMEAMAAGLPILSTSVGGVPELVASGKEGLLVRPGDPEGLANSMSSLLENPGTRRVMGAAAAQRARDYFDVSRMVQEYAQLYEDLAAYSHRANAERVLLQPEEILREV